MEGVGKFLIPVDSPEAEVTFFRGTTFSLIYDSTTQLLEDRISFSGNLVWHSIQVIVPRIFYEDKPDEMTDELIAKQLRISFDPGIDDLSTSVLAIGIADFGWVGIPFSACIVYLTISLFEYVLVQRRGGALSIPFLGAWFVIIFGVETSLVGFLGFIRDAAIAFIMLWIVDKGISWRRGRWMMSR